MKKVYDLSVTIANYGYDPRPAEIEYRNHKDNARYYAGTTGVDPSAFPDGEALNTETLTILTNTGTHLDAPWHYGTQSEGKPAMTIDDVPLEWCYGDGVVLDFRHKGPQDVIDVADLEEELKRIGYTLKPGDIPCIMCLGGDQYLTNKNYYSLHTGITKEALFWMLDQGIKVIGTDGWSLDKPMKYMKEDYFAGNKDAMWPVHFAGRERAYCHIEKLTNLDLLPKPFGFKIYFFPIKIARASAGWCRPVAIFED